MSRCQEKIRPEKFVKKQSPPLVMSGRRGIAFVERKKASFIGSSKVPDFSCGKCGKFTELGRKYCSWQTSFWFPLKKQWRNDSKLFSTFKLLCPLRNRGRPGAVIHISLRHAPYSSPFFPHLHHPRFAIKSRPPPPYSVGGGGSSTVDSSRHFGRGF